MPADLSSLASTIERLHAAGADADRTEARSVFATLRAELSAGRARAASPDPDSPTGWTVNAWVKQGILVGFRCGEIISVPGDAPHVPFLDKDTLPLRSLDTSSRVRLVPGGSSIRDGAFIGAGVICMPPMFINIGAYVGADSLIDSHALVGSSLQRHPRGVRCDGVNAAEHTKDRAHEGPRFVPTLGEGSKSVPSGGTFLFCSR